MGYGLQWEKTVVDTILYPGWGGHAGIADLNSDGNLDIHIGGWNRFNGLYVYFGNGNGEFRREAVWLDHGVGEFNSIAIGDLNGDRVMDIVTNRYNETRDTAPGLVAIFGSHDVFVPVSVGD